jgi:hypothetical protein
MLYERPVNIHFSQHYWENSPIPGNSVFQVPGQREKTAWPVIRRCGEETYVPAGNIAGCGHLQ